MQNEQRRMLISLVALLAAAPLVAHTETASMPALVLGWGLVGLSLLLPLWSCLPFIKKC